MFISQAAYVQDARTFIAPGAYLSLTKALEAGLAVPLELTGEPKSRGLIGIVTFSF